MLFTEHEQSNLVNKNDIFCNFVHFFMLFTEHEQSNLVNKYI